MITKASNHRHEQRQPEGSGRMVHVFVPTYIEADPTTFQSIVQKLTGCHHGKGTHVKTRYAKGKKMKKKKRISENVYRPRDSDIQSSLLQELELELELVQNCRDLGSSAAASDHEAQKQQLRSNSPSSLSTVTSSCWGAPPASTSTTDHEYSTLTTHHQLIMPPYSLTATAAAATSFHDHSAAAVVAHGIFSHPSNSPHIHPSLLQHPLCQSSPHPTRIHSYDYYPHTAYGAACDSFEASFTFLPTIESSTIYHELLTILDESIL